jgi:putative glutamine amidotransferase
LRDGMSRRNLSAMKDPVIGITLDCESGGNEAWSRYDWYALRRNYAEAVVSAGGVPVLLPHEPGMVDAYLDLIDGLLVTGGNFDIDPALYGAADRHDTVKTKAGRTDFEWEMTEGALERDLPVLGICGGQQLLHVVLGGTLIQHIPDAVENALPHEQANPRHEAGHMVVLEPGTLLQMICGVDAMQVNSAHHQAAADAPAGVAINARAPDGVIEGIESSRHRFALGVQWHPEFMIDPADERIFAAFIAEAAGLGAAGYASDED